jgi:hypothetical protein
MVCKQSHVVGDGQPNEASPDVEFGQRTSAALARTSMSEQPLLQRHSSLTDAPAAAEPAAHKAGEAAALTAKARDFSNAVVFGVINGIVGMSSSYATLHVRSRAPHICSTLRALPDA